MSNFYCEKCGIAIIDSPHGYVTGCEHYPPDVEPTHDLGSTPDIKNRVSKSSENSDLLCDQCGRTFNTCNEGVTTSKGRELCGYCSCDTAALEPDEFIPD